MGATEALANFVCTADAIPAAARNEARRSLLDTLGTMLLGSTDPAGVMISDFVLGQSTGGTAWIAGRRERTSPMLAALANGTMGHALDFDDATVFGHPGVALVPAGLATAELQGSSGRELLDALVLGIEVAGRIALATSNEPYSRGYHGTSLFGIVGATAAVGRLLHLDEQQQRHAAHSGVFDHPFRLSPTT
jgi:2-methylcitrate dehydratase PrpD